MKVIKGLIIKDLLQLKNYKKTLIAFLFIFILTAITQESISEATSMLIVMITLGFGMVAMGTFSYDELANADKYILTFPATKKEVVLAKYMLVGIATILGAILGMVVTVILTLALQKGLPNFADIAMLAIGSIFGITLVTSFQIPCVIKSGAEKGRIQMFIIIAVVAFGLGGLISLGEHLGLFIDGFLFVNLLEIVAPFLLIFLIAIIYTISYRVSCHFYEKKEM